MEGHCDPPNIEDGLQMTPPTPHDHLRGVGVFHESPLPRMRVGRQKTPPRPIKEIFPIPAPPSYSFLDILIRKRYKRDNVI